MLYVIVSDKGYVHCILPARNEAERWIQEYESRTPATRTKYYIIERPLLASWLDCGF